MARRVSSSFQQDEAFTLIELLCVIAIIAVISGFVFVAGSSTAERAKRARATAELASLGAALEAYRNTNGDYPRTADAAVLLQSLIGKRGPTFVAMEGKPVIELSHLHTLGDLDPYVTSSAQLADPWGGAYVYAYKSVAPWNQVSYVLFSSGPDGAHAALLTGGRVDDAAAENQDNLYAR